MTHSIEGTGLRGKYSSIFCRGGGVTKNNAYVFRVNLFRSTTFRHVSGEVHGFIVHSSLLEVLLADFFTLYNNTFFLSN